jgi:hypothetical protein
VPDYVAARPRFSLVEQVRTTAIAAVAFVVTVLQRGIVRKRRVNAVESTADGLSDLALVALGLLRMAPQDADELATQLGLRVEEVDGLLRELEARGYVGGAGTVASTR